MVLYSMLLLSFVCSFVPFCVCVCDLEDQGGMLSGVANYAEPRVSVPRYRPALSAARSLTFPYRELPQRRADCLVPVVLIDFCSPLSRGLPAVLPRHVLCI